MPMTAQTPRPLPEGRLVAWYGDDFTGSAAVAEALTFSGLEAVLFFDLPTQAQLAQFPTARGIGIAGAARAKSPGWMDRHLPTVFEALAKLGAPVSQYKICSTLDSAPHLGSIGRAMDLAAPCFPDTPWPIVVAAPAIRRYQAFGNLFADYGGRNYRLDRHPVMQRHPATPMTEGDVARHIALQTDMPLGLVDLVAMKSGTTGEALKAAVAEGAKAVTVDVVDDATLAEAGRLIWELSPQPCFTVGSQGVEYALVAYWQAAGLLSAPRKRYHASEVDRMAIVSGSCSATTAEQIAWASARGSQTIRIDARRAIAAADWEAEIERATAAALDVLSAGSDPIVLTATGPDDPAIAAFRAALATAGAEEEAVNARIGDGLGRILDRLVRRGRLQRAVIAGGDTSSHAAAALSVFALTALAPTVPGAALFKAHSEDPALETLELALKGGQMGAPDYFGQIKQGGAKAGGAQL